MNKDIITICITNKNRSKIIVENKILYLLPDCIKSIANSIEDNNVELVISDWGSTDWPIEDWITNKAPEMPIHIIDIESEKFSVGRGRNIAAEYANGDFIFFLDTDIVVNREGFNEAILLAKKNNFCFPKIIYQQKYNTEDYILDSGAGNIIISKELFYEIGKWPEYWSYGFEDIEFAKKLKTKIGTLPTTETPFIHQWHPKQHGWTKEEDKKLDKIKNECILEVNRNPEIDILKDLVNLNLKRNPHTTHRK